MKYFGTDGIRGVANQYLTPEIAFKVGRYLGDSLKEKKVIVIGKDSRISCDMLEAALVAGITSAGGDVYKVGVIPTPAVCQLVPVFNANYGIIISASHNPVLDNGIKVVDNFGVKISSQLESEIENFIDSEDNVYRATAGRIGNVHEKRDAVFTYIEMLTKTISSNLDGIKVVIDCANGAASYVANSLFANFNCNHIVINNEPNGLNINDKCGSTCTNMLKEAVLENKADLGIALDGDADRIICVDNEGYEVDGDILVYILAQKYIRDEKLKVPGVALTSMSNLGIINALKADLNIDAIITDVGDKYVSRALEEHGLILGGEVSGHIILKDISNSGDGLLVGLQILDLLATSGQKLSNYRKNLVKYPSILTNIRVIDKEYTLTHRNLIEEIKRVENILGDSGRVVVRASGTENLIRVLVECEDKTDCEQFSASITETVKNIGGS